jgi:hypothetical protein
MAHPEFAVAFFALVHTVGVMVKIIVLVFKYIFSFLLHVWIALKDPAFSSVE